MNYTSLATIIADRWWEPDHVSTASNALNLATLVTFNGTAATGNLDISSPVRSASDVVVDGGSGQRHVHIPGRQWRGGYAVTVRGNAGNDTFMFLT